MLFAYMFEGHPEFKSRVPQISRRMEERGDTLWDEASKLREFFRSPDLRLLDFKLSTAEIFAEIRGRGGISAGDAIHLACAAEARVDLFLTHDKRLAKKIVPGIQFIATLDTNVL